LKEDYIRALEKKAEELGYHNIEVYASSASDLSFIKNGSVDFVLANGLLCNMVEHRPLAVKKIKRILKPTGQAYLSLGGYPPFGFVDRAEWEKILEGFRVERRGGFLQKWALVSKKENGKQVFSTVITAGTEADQEQINRLMNAIKQKLKQEITTQPKKQNSINYNMGMVARERFELSSAGPEP